MTFQDRRCRPRDRPGFGMIEMAITGLLVAVALTATLKVVGWVALERQAVGRRERALREASNLMERIVARPWDEISTGSLGSLRLPEAAASAIPGATASAAVVAEDGAPARKRIALEIRWKGRSGMPEAPVRIVGWAFRPGGSAR